MSKAAEKHGLPLFLVSLLFFVVAAAGTEAQTDSPKLKAVVFPHHDLTGTEASAPYREILYGALERRLLEEGFEVLPRTALEADPGYAALEPVQAASGESILSVAAGLGAETAAGGVYGIDGRRLFIQVKLYDVRTGKVVAAAMEYGLAGLAGYSLAGEMADGLAPEIQAYLASYNPSEPLTYEAVEGIILRSSDEGMEVTYETGDPFGKVTDGVIRPPYVPFLVGSVVQIRKSKPGYYPAAEQLTLGAGVSDITLKPLDRKYRNETSLYWTNGQALGAGIGYRYYPNPDYFFAGADFQSYAQYDFQKGNRPVLHNEFSVNIGSYLFSSYRSRFRLGISAGAGVIVTSFTVPDMPVYTDYYINFANLFLDINLRPWTFFINSYGKYSLGWGSNILGRGHFGGENIGPPVSLGVRKKW